MSQYGSYTRPWLYDKQRDAIFNDKRYAVVEASTKTGKTVGCLVWIVEQALAGKPGENFWWVAPVYRQAQIFWRRLKAALPPDFPYEANETDRWLLLPNGALIWALSAERPDTLYGEDVHAVVIDEATRCKTDAWHAIRSTMTATKGKVRIIGNVKGRKNWAYQLARRAETGDPNMHYAKLTAYDAVDAEILDKEEIEDAKRQLPENVFRELYLAEPSDDGGNPFGEDAILACIGELSTDDPFVWGWDLAKAQNYSVGIALDKDGRVCRFERFQRDWEATFQRVILSSGSAPTLVDATPGSAGDPLLERLQAGGRHNFQGFKFNTSSKQQLFLGLAAAIQKREITFPDGDIKDELLSFEYEYTRAHVIYRAAEGGHDDCVDALALALYNWNQQQSSLIVVAPVAVSSSSYWRSV